jgi:hypothetical protein
MTSCEPLSLTRPQLSGSLDTADVNAECRRVLWKHGARVEFVKGRDSSYASHSIGVTDRKTDTNATISTRPKLSTPPLAFPLLVPL